MAVLARSTRVFSIILAIAIALVGVLALAAAVSAAPGNSGAAHACQKGGHANYTRADGSTFRNAGQCVSYVAQGGELLEVVTQQIWADLPDTPGGTHFLNISGFTPNSAIEIELDWIPSGNSEFYPLGTFSTDANGEWTSSWFVCIYGPNDAVTAKITDAEGLTATAVLPISC